MFEYFICFLHIIDCVLCWIEDHPVFIGVTVPMLVGVFGVKKYIKNKRLEACLGLYASLKLQINYLKTLLNEKKMLNTEEPELGNIYSLIYDASIISTICPAFHFPESEYLSTISDCCKKIQDTLIESKCNINPSSISRSEWDNGIQTIYNFCEFILTFQKNTSLKISNEKDISKAESQYKHIQLCNNLIQALNSIINAIDKACEELL